jgi:hypothetical protein
MDACEHGVSYEEGGCIQCAREKRTTGVLIREAPGALPGDAAAATALAEDRSWKLPNDLPCGKPLTVGGLRGTCFLPGDHEGECKPAVKIMRPGNSKTYYPTGHVTEEAYVPSGQTMAVMGWTPKPGEHPELDKIEPPEKRLEVFGLRCNHTTNWTTNSLRCKLRINHDGPHDHGVFVGADFDEATSKRMAAEREVMLHSSLVPERSLRALVQLFSRHALGRWALAELKLRALKGG